MDGSDPSPTKPGKRINGHDVARRASVSQATVSRALRGDPRISPGARARVLTAADELGYVPSGLARSLSRRQTDTVGVVVADLVNPFYPELLQAIHQELTMGGLRVVLLVDPLDAASDLAGVSTLLDQSLDGVIITTARVDSVAPAFLTDRGLSVVLAARTVDGAKVDSVVSDNVTAGEIAAEHLLGLGHRRVGLILGPERTSVARDREVGVRRRFAADGVVLDPALRRAGRNSHESGYTSAQELLREPDRPTASVCGNDVIALGVLEAANRLGVSVPHDVSIIGFDDIPMAGWSAFELTTVRQNIDQMGRLAARRLMERLHERYTTTTPHQDILPTSLVIRRTTAPPTRRNEQSQ